MVFQSYALFGHLDVAGNVAFGLKRKKRPKDEIDAARRRRARAGRAWPTGRTTGRTSSRAASASALPSRARSSTARRCLLLDEPLGALDLKLRRQMQVELKQIQREVGITFVYVTHDQEEALSMSDRIAVMSGGRIAQCGPPEDIYEHPTGEFVAGFIGISNLIEGGSTGDGAVKIATGQSVRGAGSRRIAAPGDTVQISVRPEKIAIDDEVEDGMVSVEGTIEGRVYLGVSTQITVGLGNGARLVALEQATYRASADDRWEPGMTIRVGWHPENSIVLR